MAVVRRVLGVLLLVLGTPVLAAGIVAAVYVGPDDTAFTGPHRLSTDGVAMRPVAVPTEAGHGIAVHPVGNLSLSFDHRAFDGAYASAFLRRVVELVETRRWDEELA